MLTIYLDEVKRELLSVKTLLISLVLIGIALIAGKYSPSLQLIAPDSQSLSLVNTLFSIYGILGFLFSSIIFSGIFTKDIDSQAIRYITPYIHRIKIYFAKYLAMVSYFTLILLISLVIIFITRETIFFPLSSFINMIVFFSYIEAVIILLSIVCSKERMANFIGVFISIIFPAIGAWAMLSNNKIAKTINWILPFRYVESSWDILILIGITVILIIVSLSLFIRKEI
jgi:ABC-type transport system involved in multi-copper enzyme maturation permease subunit